MSGKAVKAFSALEKEAVQLVDALARYGAIKRSAGCLDDDSPIPTMLRSRFVSKLIMHAEEACSQLRQIVSEMKAVAARAQRDADKSEDLVFLQVAFLINEETSRKMQLIEKLVPIGEVDDVDFFNSLADAWPSPLHLFPGTLT